MNTLRNLLEGLLSKDMDVDITPEPILSYMVMNRLGWEVGGDDIIDHFSRQSWWDIVKDEPLSHPGPRRRVRYESHGKIQGEAYIHVSTPDKYGYRVGAVTPGSIRHRGRWYWMILRETTGGVRMVAQCLTPSSPDRVREVESAYPIHCASDLDKIIRNL